MAFIVPSKPGSTVGNARGTAAVDLQQPRDAATKVASGNYSVVLGGKNNTASTSYTITLGGFGNASSASYAMALGGKANTVSGLYATVINGNASTASGFFSIASGQQAVADKRGQCAHASGRFAASGDAQTSLLVVRNSTTTNAQTELFIEGSSTRVTIANDTTWAFQCLIVARRTDANDESAGYLIQGVIDRNAAANTTALVGSVTVTVLAEDTAGWDATAEADATNGALVLKVTGENSKTIRWVGRLVLTECTG